MDEVTAVFLKDVDRSLIRENLKLSYEQRALRLVGLQQAAEAVQKAGEALRARKKSQLG